MIEMRGKIGDVVVFGVSGPDDDWVTKEAIRYAKQYREEGDVLIQQKLDGRWLRAGVIYQDKKWALNDPR